MYASYIKSKLKYEYVFWNYAPDLNSVNVLLGQMPNKLYLFKHTQIRVMSICFDTSRYTKLPHTHSCHNNNAFKRRKHSKASCLKGVLPLLVFILS